jgi:hypothetical protein
MQNKYEDDFNDLWRVERYFNRLRKKRHRKVLLLFVPLNRKQRKRYNGRRFHGQTLYSKKSIITAIHLFQGEDLPF